MKKPKITLLAGALLCVLVFSFALSASAETPADPAPDIAAAQTTDTDTGEATETAPTAPAAPAFFPYEITTQDDAGETLLLKKYRVPDGTDVSALVEQGLTRLGRPYSLWGVTAVTEEAVVEHQDVAQDYELYVHTSDPDAARAEVKESIEYDADGFTGALTLTDLTCAAEQQVDGTYLAAAHYAGTVTRTHPGSTEYTLYYAPDYEHTGDSPAGDADIVPTQEIVSVSLIAAAVLLAVVLIICLMQYRRDKKDAPPAAEPDPAPKPRPTVYVPSTDFVPGSDKEDDLDDEL